MSEYRFSLQKYKRGSKLSCLKCGKKQCFVKYIDNQGEITFPDYVGRCDHEQSCKYHYTPLDYFNDNPTLMNYSKYNFTKVSNPKPCLPPSFIDKELMERSLTNYVMNPLYIYLSGVLGKDEILRIFRLYHVGTSKKWGGSTVYWQIDWQGNVRTGKIMLYDSATGHRIKDPRSYVSWVHTELNLQDYHLKQCFFGEHLLPENPTKPVAIVESEKSALIATHYMPEFIWLGTGGMHGCFKSDVVNVLKGRSVMLCPDLGAKEVWQAKMPLLTSVCSKVVLSDSLEQCATDEQRKNGLDIADFLLMTDTPMMILQKMIKRNPNLQTLIDCLHLELVDSS
ncbi:DUF6371 domain-containing protein [Bacteroides fluxus]|jgi:hypothetical protein